MKVDPISLLAGYPPPIMRSGVLEREHPELQPFRSMDLSAIMFHLTAASIPISSLEQRYNSLYTEKVPEWRNSLAFFVDWRPIRPYHIGYLWCGNVAQLQSTEPLGFSLLEISVRTKRSAKGAELGTYEGQYWIVNVNGAMNGWAVLAAEVRFYFLKGERLPEDLNDLLSVHDLFTGDIELVDVAFPEDVDVATE